MDWRHLHRTWFKCGARFVVSAFPIDAIVTYSIWKVKNVCAYNPRSCFILADESCGVFSRVWTVAWCSSGSKPFHVVSVIG